MLPLPLPVGLQPTLPAVQDVAPTACPLDRWRDSNGRINVPYTRAIFFLTAEAGHPSRYPPYDPVKRAIQVIKHNKMEYIDVFSFQ